MRVSGSLLAAGVFACAFALGGCQSKDEESPIPLTTEQCLKMPGASVVVDKDCPRTVSKLFVGKMDGRFRCSFAGRPGVCIDNGL